MRIIPVIDVMNGVVVRGVGGRRREYRPIVSTVTASIEPTEVARALYDCFRPNEMYLADLDAIQGEPQAISMYRYIRELGARLWVDAGIATPAQAKSIADLDCDVVAGLETVRSAAALEAIVDRVGPERVLFSLDLRNGAPLRTWPDRSPLDGCLRSGIRRLIVLDLAQVGRGDGIGTEPMCRELVSTGEFEVFAGGGISSAGDLRRLEAIGVAGVLIASALHDGRISPRDSGGLH